MELKLTYHLTITKGNEVVNELEGNGINALMQLSKTISQVLNKKNYYNVVKTHKTELHSVFGKSLKITIWYNVIDGEPLTCYRYIFKGEDLEKVYNY